MAKVVYSIQFKDIDKKDDLYAATRLVAKLEMGSALTGNGI